MDPPPHLKLQPPELLSYAPASPRSPEKQTATPLDFDPLLNLSPATVIELLRGADADDPQDALHDILRDVSASERAFGLRAAVAAKKISEWCSELLAWQWPGTFEHPLQAQGAAGTTAEGCMPPEAVARLESRVETVKDEYDALDLEELKGFVRSAHLMPSSRGSSLYEVDFMALSQFNRLDDFTALITSTIMHALPYLQRLRRLLDVWSVRLLVLHQVPGFLADLESTKAAVDAAWTAIGYGTTTEKPRVSREAFGTMRSVLRARVTELGAKIDAMLDALEGHQDSLPEYWIDEMEAVQADCENWVVVAERDVEEGEWRARQDLEVAGPLDGTASLAESTKELQLSSSAGELVAGLASRDAPASQTPPDVDYSHDARMAVLPGDGTIHGDLGDDHSHPHIGTEEMRTQGTAFASGQVEVHPTLSDIGPGEGSPGMTAIENADQNQGEAVPGYPLAASVASSLSGGSEEEEPAAPESPALSRAKSHLSRASVASIEVIPRKDVRKITITRSSSNASAANFSPARDEDVIGRVSSPSGLKNEARSPALSDRSSRASSPAFEEPPLYVRKRNPSPSKAQFQNEDPEQDDEFHDAVDSLEPAPQVKHVPKTLEDQLAARITSILSNIPANIKLKSGIHDEPNEGKHRTASQPTRAASAQALPRGSRSVTPALTLAPATDKGSRPRANQDQGEIKVYHLHQPDREHPIKLYVRLVGEGGERVMVRVGGGWADLGEYLKEYALHHGRRSASDGKLGIMGISNAEQSTVQSIEPAESGRVTPNNDSPLANRRLRASSGVPATPPRTPEAAVRRREETPGSVESARSGSHLEDDTPLGLAGPKNKDVELSPKKRAWVNGMLNQARQASAEKKKKPSLTELGKAGSTRRFFRGKGGT